MASTAPSLVLRADAGPALGGGHVMRCLAIAAAFREVHGDRAQVSFVRSAGPPDAFDARIAAVGGSSHWLPARAGLIEDAEETADLALSIGAAWTVVDGYGFDGRYEEHVGARGLRVLALDDHAHTRHRAAVIVSPGLAARPDLQAAHPGTPVLAGPEFALLRPEFWPHRAVRREPRDPLVRILVTLGASDPGRLGPRVVEALAGLPGVDVRLVLGAANSHAEETSASCRDAGFAVLHDVRDMAEQMLWADVALSGAGGTLLELLLLGVPSLTVIVAENQRRGAEAARARGLTHLIGTAQEAGLERIRREVATLLGDPASAAEMSRRGQAALDGFGAHRVCLALDAVSNSLSSS